MIMFKFMDAFFEMILKLEKDLMILEKKYLS